jgi:hypothetical protein
MRTVGLNLAAIFRRPLEKDGILKDARVTGIVTAKPLAFIGSLHAARISRLSGMSVAGLSLTARKQTARRLRYGQSIS